jgi:ATP-dependent Clp protease ATP-binding subunit ClpB
VDLDVDDEARTFIAHAAYEPAYGARPLRRWLQRHVESPLARLLVSGEVEEGGEVLVRVADEELTVLPRRA